MGVKKEVGDFRVLRELARVYRNAEVDFLDGICVQHADWWFNVRKSNTMVSPGSSVQATMS